MAWYDDFNQGGGGGITFGGEGAPVPGTPFNYPSTPNNPLPPPPDPGPNNLDELREAAERERQRLESERQARLSRLQEKEEQIRGAITGSQDSLDNALEAQLDRLLADVGYKAGVARQDIGAGYAARGLGRSSFAQGKLNEVTLGEQEEKGTHRNATLATSQAAREYTQNAYDTIALRREKIQSAQSQAELDQAEGILKTIDFEKIKQDLNVKLTELQLGARDQNFLVSSLSGLFSGLTGIFSGIVNKPEPKK